jgi:hypothetical protein
VVVLALTCAPVAVFAKGGAAGGAAAAASTIMAHNRHHAQLLAFREFLRQNPGTAVALRTSPRDARDPAFLGAHKELDAYLQTHRPFAKRLRRNPDRVMSDVAKLKS